MDWIIFFRLFIKNLKKLNKLQNTKCKGGINIRKLNSPVDSEYFQKNPIMESKYKNKEVFDIKHDKKESKLYILLKDSNDNIFEDIFKLKE